MPIHGAVTGINLRWFSKESTVDLTKPIGEMSEPYDRFCTVSINDVGEARIEGVTFTVSHSERRELFRLLRSYGASKVTWRHAGKSETHTL